MDPEAYDRWYETPRGRWIGERELSLLLEGLEPRAGESLLDVGCGTGHFTRALAGATAGPVAGADIDMKWLAYARERDRPRAAYAAADARALPYPNGSFDLVVAVTALCFVRDELAAVREIARVARRRFAIGLLNRHSLLWFREGMGGGRGGYRGSRWHTAADARALFRDVSVHNLQLRTAVHIPSGGRFAQHIERIWPASILTGAFLLAVGDVAAPGQSLRAALP